MYCNTYYKYYDQFEPDGCDDIINDNCAGLDDNHNCNAFEFSEPYPGAYDAFCLSTGLSAAGCGYKETYYDHGALVDLDGDGGLGELCLVTRWYDPDRDQWACLGYTSEICWGSLLCWIPGGESSSFGEYNTGTSTECCGDDGGEYIRTGFDHTICCDNPTDCIDSNGVCRSAGTC